MLNITILSFHLLLTLSVLSSSSLPLTVMPLIHLLQPSHLSLGEAQRHRQLSLSPHCDVAVALKLLLQLHALLVSVYYSVLVLGASLPC